MALRLIVPALVLTGFGLSAWADDKAPDPKKTAKNLAQKINSALLKGDYATIAELTHPRVVKEAGGKEKMIEFMKSVTKEMKDKGFEFRSAKLEEPTNPVPSGKELYIVVPFKMQMKAPGGKLIQATYLLGVSEDQGKTWTFINGDEAANKDELKKLLPNMPATLKLPKIAPPKFEKE